MDRQQLEHNEVEALREERDYYKTKYERCEQKYKQLKRNWEEQNDEMKLLRTEVEELEEEKEDLVQTIRLKFWNRRKKKENDENEDSSYGIHATDNERPADQRERENIEESESISVDDGDTPHQSMEMRTVAGDRRSTRSAATKTQFPIGTIIRKKFRDENNPQKKRYYEGIVIGFNRDKGWYIIRYGDEDEEEMNHEEVMMHRKTIQTWGHEEYNQKLK